MSAGQMHLPQALHLIREEMKKQRVPLCTDTTTDLLQIAKSHRDMNVAAVRIYQLSPTKKRRANLTTSATSMKSYERSNKSNKTLKRKKPAIPLKPRNRRQPKSSSMKNRTKEKAWTRQRCHREMSVGPMREMTGRMNTTARTRKIPEFQPDRDYQPAQFEHIDNYSALSL